MLGQVTLHKITRLSVLFAKQVFQLVRRIMFEADRLVNRDGAPHDANPDGSL